MVVPGVRFHSAPKGRNMLRLPARGRHVTREPLMVDPDLLGAPLATFRRRLAAYVMDLALFGLVVGGFFVAVSLWSIHRSEPELLGRLGDAVGNASSSAAADSNLGVDLMRLIAEVYIDSGDQAVVSDICFPVYANATRIVGGEAIAVPLDDWLQYDLDCSE